MKHINVYVTVDGVRKPVGTYDLVDAKGNDLSAVAEAHAFHASSRAIGKLSEEGRDVSNVRLEKVYVDTETLGADKNPVEFLDSRFKNPKGN